MATINVIVPVYNVEPYLHRCVDSILAQSYRDFRLILVDDGSPDACGVICDDYAKHDPRVVVIHQANGGLSAARNAGIDLSFANGDSHWLIFIDSDDFIHPQTLQLLLAAAEEHGTDISIGGFQRTPGEPPVVEARNLISCCWDTKTFFLQNNVNAVIACGKLIRRSLFANLRYPVGRLHEDEFTTYKLLFQCEKIAAIAAPLYAYYENPKSIMNSAWSPRRMDGVEAFRERINYFEALADPELVEYAVKSYVNHTAHQYEQAEAHPSLRKQMQKLLRNTLRQYHRLLPRKEYAWIYSIAFPRRTLLAEHLGL